MITWKPADASRLDGDHLGRYRLFAQLGAGGMGTIHLALTSGLGDFRKLLVVKELQRDLAMNDKFVEMFMSEAKLAARLSHPNIVQTLEAGEVDGRYFLTMEFLDGQPLTELLKRANVEPAVSFGMRMQILCDVLNGLQYAHELCDFDGTPYRIVHRDINPHNVFVTYHGEVKLVDFGIAKAVDVESLTSAGVFKGKFAYAAPEQVRGEQVDARSDLFAVGVMLWELIAQRRFAPGAPTKLSIDQRIRGLEPRIREAAPDVDAALAEICDRALAVNKEDRFASAREFRGALERYLLVSGEAPNESLGALLCTKFAAERSAMHAMIDTCTKRDERHLSVVRSLQTSSDAPRTRTTTPVPRPARSDGPTVVRDLRPGRATTPSERPAVASTPPPAAEITREWAARLRGQHHATAWVGAALLLGLALYLWLRPAPRDTPPSLPPVQTSAPPAPPQPTAATPPAPHAEPALAASATQAPALDSVPAPPPSASEPEPDATAAAEAKPVRTPRWRKAVRHEDGSPTRARASAPSEPVPAAPSAAPAPTSQPAQVGQDLRGLPKRQQRPIDLEDPFR